MHKRAFIGAILLALLLLPQCSAWGHETHRDATARALDSLPDEVKAFYEPYREEIIHYSTIPDIWRVQDDPRGDILYHLCYPTGYGLGPEAVEEWYAKLIEDICDGNVESISLGAGVLSHYVGDSLCALHTDAYVPEHPAIERYVNENVSSFDYGAATEGTFDDVKDAVRSRSLVSHGYYQPVVEACRKNDWNEVEACTLPQLESYASTFATLLCMAYDDAVASQEVQEEEKDDYTPIVMACAAMACMALLAVAFRRR